MVTSDDFAGRCPFGFRPLPRGPGRGGGSRAAAFELTDSARCLGPVVTIGGGPLAGAVGVPLLSAGHMLARRQVLGARVLPAAVGVVTEVGDSEPATDLDPTRLGDGLA